MPGETTEQQSARGWCLSCRYAVELLVVLPLVQVRQLAVCVYTQLALQSVTQQQTSKHAW